jgi:triosephosphate isomerase (TIM)
LSNFHDAKPFCEDSFMTRPKLVIGNWKMNGSRSSNAELLSDLKTAAPHPTVHVAVCVPHVYLADVARELAGSSLAVGAQDCSTHESGAYTGEVSAAMLADCGGQYVLVGHSERRAQHAESDVLVAEKAQIALKHDLTPVVCVGETLSERESGQTEAVVQRQLSAVIQVLGTKISQIVVAYEPVWAIGTGLTATPEQAQAVHAFLRQLLAKATDQAGVIPLLYGGSVKADNAASLFVQADIDGGLIGGASLKAADFKAIAAAAVHKAAV